MKSIYAYLVVLLGGVVTLLFVSRWRLAQKYQNLKTALKSSKARETTLVAAQVSAASEIKDLTNKLTTLRELSTGVAHDIRTNFGSILDLISVFKGKETLPNPDVHQLLEGVSRYCLHGRGVIQSLSYTSKENPVSTTQKSDSTTTGLSILLVDDDELIRLSFTPMLEILGHEVTTASGGLEAVQLLERGLGVDVVILDMNMPGFDGAQTLTRILMHNPDQRVLMASGMSSEEAIAKLISGLPNVGRLHKPFTISEIREKLASPRN